MSNNTAGKSRVLPGAFFTMLIAVFGFTSCGGGGGGGANSAATTPVSIFVSSTSIPYNSSIDISWSSTNSTSCVSTGGGGTSATGTFNTGPLTTTTSYTVTCGTASQSVTITVGSQAVAAAITGFANAGGGNVTVTAANSSLANGDTITIYGTTNYNGTYTVANRTATSFTIVATFVSNDATGVWQRAGGTISGCTTTGATGNISLSNVPARLTGVAPLSVFFDASASTATATTRPFHDLEYRWNFGEDPAILATLPGGANWPNGSTNGSRNLATGPVAAHVFETPGLYTVTLTATDGTNSVTNSCAQIAVQYPDNYFSNTNTICIAANSDPTPGLGGCPSGAAHYQQSNFVTAINTYRGTGKRILFKRGDTFTATAVNTTWATIAVNGPGIVGAYGYGAIPTIQATDTNSGTNGYSVLVLSSSTALTMSDWRIMDLKFDGSTSPYFRLNGVEMLGNCNQLTLLRLQSSHIQSIVGNSSLVLDVNEIARPGQLIWNEIAIVDFEVTNVPSGVAGLPIYLAADRLFFAGNNIDNEGSAGVSHTARFPYLGKAVISNNTLLRPGPTEHSIKLHAPIWQTFTANTIIGSTTINGIANTANYLAGTKITGNGIPAGTSVASITNSTTLVLTQAATATATGVTLTNNLTSTAKAGVGGGYSRWVIISDNKLVGSNNAASVMVAPQNGASDERIKDIIVERNWFVAGSGTQKSLAFNSVDSTARNNIFNMTGGAYHEGIDIAQRGIEPAPSNINIYNNTFYSGSTGDFYGVGISATSTNITVKNNIGYAPYASVQPLKMVNDLGSVGLIELNNSTITQIRTVFPGWVSITPAFPEDFKLTAGSYALGTGLAVPVFSDFSLQTRPPYDIGATGQ